ncbi:MAG: YHS domain-containing protein [Vicinamibacterales bacterium]
MLRYVLLGILLILIARAFWRVIDSVIEAAGGRPRVSSRRTPQAVRLVRDPVCGTHVAPSSALQVVADGRAHHFCSETCRSEFLKQQRA